MPRVLLPDGLEIAYDAVGQGRAVLLLHGWATSRRVWAGQMADLAENLRLVAYDARGCGDSGRPGHGYTIAQGPATPSPSPTHWGSADLCLPDPPWAATLRWRPRASRPSGSSACCWSTHRSIGRRRPAARRPGSLARASARRPFFHCGGDRAKVVRGKRARALTRWTVDRIVDADWAIDGLIRDAADGDPRQWMGEVSVPTTLMHGVLDPEVPVTVAKEAAALLPQAHVDLFERCAHMPHLEERLDFSRRLLSIAEGGENGGGSRPGA